jgi:hypothetical protein
MATGNPLTDEFRNDILTAWGQDRLVTVPADRVPANAVSPSAQTLLTELGLPDYVHENISFHHDRRLLQSVTANSVDYRLLGEDSGVPIAIKAHTDEVWALAAGPIPQRFINTHPAFLVLFLGVLLSSYELLREAEPAEARTSIDDLRAAFTELDPLAFTNPNNWWPGILEVAQDGYL